MSGKRKRTIFSDVHFAAKGVFKGLITKRLNKKISPIKAIQSPIKPNGSTRENKNKRQLPSNKPTSSLKARKSNCALRFKTRIQNTSPNRTLKKVIDKMVIDPLIEKVPRLR